MCLISNRHHLLSLQGFTFITCDQAVLLPFLLAIRQSFCQPFCFGGEKRTPDPRLLLFITILPKLAPANRSPSVSRRESTRTYLVLASNGYSLQSGQPFAHSLGYRRLSKFLPSELLFFIYNIYINVRNNVSHSALCSLRGDKKEQLNSPTINRKIYKFLLCIAWK